MNNSYIYYVNGKWIPHDKAQIPFNDAGFLYGDGLFETMRFDNKKIFSPLKHLNRLIGGLKIIDLPIKYSKNNLLSLINEIINKNTLKSGIIRLMITRGELITGQKIFNPNIYLNIKPFYKIPKEPVNVIFLKESNYPIIRFTPAIKSMNYIGNMLAKKHTLKQNAFEPIFYNKENIITECAIRNIFFIKKNKLYTPTLELGILSGVMREVVLDIAKNLKIETIETYINFDQINSMDEAFITSTGIGILSCYWDGWESNYNISKQIKKELFNRIKNN